LTEGNISSSYLRTQYGGGDDGLVMMIILSLIAVPLTDGNISSSYLRTRRTHIRAHSESEELSKVGEREDIIVVMVNGVNNWDMLLTGAEH
jgi:hypothetical protein